MSTFQITRTQLLVKVTLALAIVVFPILFVVVTKSVLSAYLISFALSGAIFFGVNYFNRYQSESDLDEIAIQVRRLERSNDIIKSGFRDEERAMLRREMTELFNQIETLKTEGTKSLESLSPVASYTRSVSEKIIQNKYRSVVKDELEAINTNSLSQDKRLKIEMTTKQLILVLSHVQIYITILDQIAKMDLKSRKTNQLKENLRGLKTELISDEKTITDIMLSLQDETSIH